MNFRLPHLRLAVLGACFYALAASIAWRWQERLVVVPQDGMIVRAQEAGGEPLQGRFASQKLDKDPKGYSARYGFRNFNNDQLSVDFKVAKEVFDGYESQWGYKQEDVDEIKAWHEGARKAALAEAIKTHKNQVQLNQALAGLKAQYDKKLHDYMGGKGFRLMGGGVVEVDMPALVGKSGARVASLAQAFDSIAQSKGYESGDIIGAVVAMVQTAVGYKVPPNIEGGVHTGGLWHPVKTLVLGWGDCDTKTGLLASVLSNWPKIRLVGVSLPDHYVMGVLRNPLKGDLFIEYQGTQYVLVEPAGPAWMPPGMLAETTQKLLGSQEGYKVDPFF
ncbi:MAG: hypothetical protein HY077_18390 [Elusimicrobia bacterium]|nr:hypothetical protein [Elusimicrobiota bacterium]